MDGWMEHGGCLSQVVPSDPDGHCHLHRATVPGPQDGGHGAHQVCMGLEIGRYMDRKMGGWRMDGRTPQPSGTFRS